MGTPMRETPTHDRPRERLLRLGGAATSDAELIAILLGSGRVGESALEIAQVLLAEWGGLQGLAQADAAALARVPGVGPAKVSRLVAGFGLATRLATARESWPRVTSSAEIARHAAPVFAGARSERLVVLVVDGGQRLRRTETVASGSAGSCPVPVREIVATVLRHDGVGFAVAHNHPGGDPQPSAADRNATRALQAAAEATGLRFLDHVVIAGRQWRSAA